MWPDQPTPNPEEPTLQGPRWRLHPLFCTARCSALGPGALQFRQAGEQGDTGSEPQGRGHVQELPADGVPERTIRGERHGSGRDRRRHQASRRQSRLAAQRQVQHADQGQARPDAGGLRRACRRLGGSILTIRNRWNIFSGVALETAIEAALQAMPPLNVFPCSFSRSDLSGDDPLEAQRVQYRSSRAWPVAHRRVGRHRSVERRVPPRPWCARRTGLRRRCRLDALARSG
jgi:hypothetical protein